MWEYEWDVRERERDRAKEKERLIQRELFGKHVLTMNLRTIAAHLPLIRSRAMQTIQKLGTFCKFIAMSKKPTSIVEKKSPEIRLATGRLQLKLLQLGIWFCLVVVCAFEWFDHCLISIRFDVACVVFYFFFTFYIDGFEMESSTMTIKIRFNVKMLCNIPFVFRFNKYIDERNDCHWHCRIFKAVRSKNIHFVSIRSTPCYRHFLSI